MTDLYEILHVSPSAHPDVIAAAYRALARRHHPDVGGDQRAMATLNRAWEVLGDPGQRAAYDRLRAAAARATVQPGDVPPARRHDGLGRQTAYDAPTQDTDSVLDFGRYTGRSIRELAAVDPEYLEWLARTPIGRRYVHEIRQRLQARETAEQQRGRQRPPVSTPRRRFAFAGLR